METVHNNTAGAIAIVMSEAKKLRQDDIKILFVSFSRKTTRTRSKPKIGLQQWIAKRFGMLDAVKRWPVLLAATAATVYVLHGANLVLTFFWPKRIQKFYVRSKTHCECWNRTAANLNSKKGLDTYVLYFNRGWG